MEKRARSHASRGDAHGAPDHPFSLDGALARPRVLLLRGALGCALAASVACGAPVGADPDSSARSLGGKDGSAQSDSSAAGEGGGILGSSDEGGLGPDGGPGTGGDDDGAATSDDDGAATSDDGAATSDDATDDGASGTDDGGPDASDASIIVQGLPAGQPCTADGDCASGMCAHDVCTDATSCLTLLQAKPGIPSREYEIDPDGPEAGLGPFNVYCDMTTDGGGWTTLPLRFADSAYWSITTTQNSCLAVDIQDNTGNYRQYQTQLSGDLAYGYLKFLPPIPVSTVRLVDFNHTNGGANNTMDFVIGAAPTTANANYEGWFFVDPSTLSPVGYTFDTPGTCPAPYQVYLDITCSRDYLTVQQSLAAASPFPFSDTIPLSATVSGFEMVLVEGCFSIPVVPLMTCEQFEVVNPPAADGVWTTGIAVR
jgi:hypothetical protein